MSFSWYNSDLSAPHQEYCIWWSYPICSMYGIFTYIWVIYGVNVGKYSSTMEHMGYDAMSTPGNPWKPDRDPRPGRDTQVSTPRSSRVRPHDGGSMASAWWSWRPKDASHHRRAPSAGFTTAVATIGNPLEILEDSEDLAGNLPIQNGANIFGRSVAVIARFAGDIAGIFSVMIWLLVAYCQRKPGYWSTTTLYHPIFWGHRNRWAGWILNPLDIFSTKKRGVLLGMVQCFKKPKILQDGCGLTVFRLNSTWKVLWLDRTCCLE